MCGTAQNNTWCNSRSAENAGPAAGHMIWQQRHRSCLWYARPRARRWVPLLPPVPSLGLRPAAVATAAVAATAESTCAAVAAVAAGSAPAAVPLLGRRAAPLRLLLLELGRVKFGAAVATTCECDSRRQ